jgi:hypothetical protein
MQQHNKDSISVHPAVSLLRSMHQASRSVRPDCRQQAGHSKQDCIGRLQATPQQASMFRRQVASKPVVVGSMHQQAGTNDFDSRRPVMVW